MRSLSALIKINLFLTLYAKIAVKQHQATSMLSDVCQTVISETFRGKQTLCFMTDAQNLEPHFIECFTGLNSTLISANSNGFFKDSPCEGYLIVSGNFSYLKALFDYRKSKFEFRVFKDIFIVYTSGVANFLSAPFSDVADLKGNNIAVLDNISVDASLETIRISNVQLNKAFPWGLYKDQKIGKIARSWKPTFRGNSTLKLAAFRSLPFIYIDEKNEVYDGINYHISKLITRDWPITYHVYSDMAYMNMFHLVFKSVYNGVDDMAVTPFWLKTALPMGLEYTHSYTEACTTFLVPKPHELTPTWFVYQPMDSLTWISICVCAIIMGYLINIFDGTGDFPKGVLKALRILSIGPIDHISKEAHFILKPLLLTWFVVSLILATGYSTGFSSILTYPKLWDIKTMEDMVQRGIRWGMKMDMPKADLLASVEPGAKELSELYVYEENADVKNERIRSGKYATITHRLLDDYITETENLDEYSRKALKVISQCFMTNSFVYALTPNSPYKHILNQRILQVLQHGLVRFWTNQVILKNDMLYTYRFFHKYGERSAPVPLSVAKMQGIFYFLMIGYVVSIVAFIIEVKSPKMFSRKIAMKKPKIFFRM